VWRSFVAGWILILPVALTLGSTVRKDSHAIRDQRRLTAVQAEVVPPYRFPGYANVPLLLGIRRLVPPDGRLAFAVRGGGAARRIYVQTGWVRWLAFVVAPRRVVAGPGSPWVVVVGRSPGEAGIRGRRAWRFGRDWLVQR
jgi:hypothetical protein